MAIALEHPVPIPTAVPLLSKLKEGSSSPILQPSDPDTPISTQESFSSMTRSSTNSSADIHSRSPSGRGSASPIKGQVRNKIKLEDFELIRVLGKGCAGRVLLVRHSHQNTIHAMKAVSKRSVLASSELVHISTELDILKRFTIYEPHNDFVTRLNYAFTDRENFYFVMDFYPGGDLATQLEMYGTLGHVRTRFYAADLVLGLEDLHRHGVILRDLKPENILLNASGHCVIADFGLSKAFDYRGEPQPLHVPMYQGEMVLPHWAGMGMGSIRISPSGKKRIAVDKAWSFVGTTEYLAPEVVRGQEYSYAVDWWGLGCILFECLLGRVPFRKNDEEPPQVLYNRILYEPWDRMFDEPKYQKRRGSERELDAVTEGFLDALLQKDPMRRLTEPRVRDHFYFSQIDWENVRSGDYVDPHQLHLHPLAEYNTRYFPKLCLDLDPNVDMSNHNRDEENETEDMGNGKKLTALNDENTYKFEQARYKRELEDFYWSREEHEWDLVEEIGGPEEMDYEGSVVELPEEINSGGSSLSGNPLDSEISLEGTAFIEDINENGIEAVVENDARDKVEGLDRINGGDRIEEAAVQPDGKAEIVPLPNTTPTLSPTKLSGATSSMQLSPPERLITPDTSSGDIPVHIKDDSEVSPTKSQTDPSPLKLELSNPLPLPQIQPISPSPVPPSDLSLASRKVLATKKPIPVQPLLPRPSGPTRLPSGLPASGLSSSDVIVVSLPSPGLDGPRLIRRHPQITSIDSIPASRLSIDLHGAITHLGEDDWEALEAEGSFREIPSAINGNGRNVPPSSFFNRLKRRPSNIIPSGLRRATNSKSNGSSSRDSSPTKTTAMFGGTKKVIGKLKAFPMLRSRRTSTRSSETGGEGQSTSPTSESQRSTPRRPGAGRSQTEGGWFERKISSRYGKERSLTPSTEGSESISAEPSLRKGNQKWGSKSLSEGNLFGVNDRPEDGNIVGPPRVELKEMGSPVDWTLGPEVSAGLAWTKKHDERQEKI